MTGSVPGPVHVDGLTILLVEDDHGDAVLVQACLGEAGVAESSITWTRSLAEALEAMPTRPGCVLLDLGLPDADGYGAVRRMVAAMPQVPVIVLTGRQERDGIDALAAGAQDYLVKDALTGELLERSIRYAIERKRAQAAQQQLAEVQMSAVEQARLERGLLPTPLLRTAAVACATYYRPGRDGAVLGGDFFDVVETADGRLRALVGDVMGHGPDEAALGVNLRVGWRTLLLAGTPDEQILPTLAQLLRVEDDEALRYATVCDLTLHSDRLAVRLAGHPAPIVVREGRAQYLDVPVGLPLGLPPLERGAPSWPATEIVLPAGSSALLYTDGLLDAYDAGSASVGMGIPELVAALDACTRAGGAPETWIPMLLSNAPRESVDDTAVVVLTVAAG